MQLSIVTRATTTGALCLAATMASCIWLAKPGFWGPAAIMVIGTTVFWFLGRALRGHLTQLATAMELLSDEELDLTRRMPTMDTPETQRVADAFGRRTARIDARMAAAQANAASIAERSKELGARLEAAMGPIVDDSDKGGIAAQLQAIALTATTHGTLAKLLLDDAQGAIETLGQTVADIDEVSLAFADTGKVSTSTARAMRDLDEIAFQTELVALSAAVEAAHAGDNARGFTLVAKEVRRLARLSASTVQDNNAVIAQALAASQHGETLMRGLHEQAPGLLDALKSMQQKLEAVASHSHYQAECISDLASTPNESELWREPTAIETAEALGIDATTIVQELSALRGAAVTEDDQAIYLPPYPLDWSSDEAEEGDEEGVEEAADMPDSLDWEQCDADTRNDVQADAEDGTIEPSS